MSYRYHVRFSEERPWKEVTMEEFMQYERLAGFNAPVGKLATHGFGNDTLQLFGKVEYVKSA